MIGFDRSLNLTKINHHPPTHPPSCNFFSGYILSNTSVCDLLVPRELDLTSYVGNLLISWVERLSGIELSCTTSVQFHNLSEYFFAKSNWTKLNMQHFFKHILQLFFPFFDHILPSSYPFYISKPIFSWAVLVIFLCCFLDVLLQIFLKRCSYLDSP